LDKNQAITSLCQEVYDLGYVEGDFIDEVFERELLSSTAFSNQLAIPHAINQNAKHSFFSIVLNDKPMQWDKHMVNIICLFCIRKNERKEFGIVFEKIINVFSSLDNVMKLKAANDYSEFIQVLSELIYEPT